jgi:hypothetical protein
MDEKLQMKQFHTKPPSRWAVKQSYMHLLQIRFRPVKVLLVHCTTSMEIGIVTHY